ncbi:MAG: 7,8-didemethyl-8-hydroxy-5-deazariboflavin synthase subunit CofG [Hadesarchaea archaeon]|nr:7,8-didemethyl-8-hydroxy-5-deazariboflavin synthase subunit CofG [Hadesarchaea archaeon]
MMARSASRVVTYSPNVFVPLTTFCRNRCAYCGFRREEGEATLLSPQEVFSLVLRGKKAGCSEVLFTLGERPEVHPRARRELEGMGYRSISDYLEELCRHILRLGLLPHTNAGILDVEELRRLRRYNASMGLMLECASRLEAHRESPGKDPGVRLEFIERAGELRIPFTTGILVGIGEGREDRRRSLEEIGRLHERYGHIQEVIIQPFSPKPGTPMGSLPPPPEEEVLETVRMAAEILPPEVGIQIPPNLVKDVVPFLREGANDLGGISEVTPDFVNPERPWPGLPSLRRRLEAEGFRLRGRLPLYPRYARDPSFMSEEVRRVVSRLADEEGYLRPPQKD